MEEKDKMVELLRSMGADAYLSDGVVLVNSKPGEGVKTANLMAKAAAMMGYRASFGMTPVHGASSDKQTDTASDLEEEIPAPLSETKEEPEGQLSFF